MPGIVDILLRIRGDNQDAEQKLEQIGAAADRQTGRVGRLTQSLATMAARVGAIGSSAVATVEGLQQVYGRLDDLFNPNPQEDPGLAANARETASALTSAGGLRFSDLADPRNLTRRGTLFGGRSAGSEDRVKAAIDALATSNPEQLAQAIPFLPDFYGDYASEQLAKRAAAAAYQDKLKPAKAGTGTAAGAGATVVVNQGVGDPNRTGEEVRAVLERADRNNGRYTTTLNRP